MRSRKSNRLSNRAWSNRKIMVIRIEKYQLPGLLIVPNDDPGIVKVEIGVEVPLVRNSIHGNLPRMSAWE